MNHFKVKAIHCVLSLKQAFRVPNTSNLKLYPLLIYFFASEKLNLFSKHAINFDSDHFLPSSRKTMAWSWLILLGKCWPLPGKNMPRFWRMQRNLSYIVSWLRSARRRQWTFRARPSLWLVETPGKPESQYMSCSIYKGQYICSSGCSLGSNGFTWKIWHLWSWGGGHGYYGAFSSRLNTFISFNFTSTPQWE